jgi:N-acetylglucosaminyldiphosphoundecaprenol N-acetyl-beta-D-mannosaminyltransferase
MLERRANPIGRAVTAAVPRITLGGLRLAVLDIEQTANFMIDMLVPVRRVGRPLYLTSANGEVLARCSTEPMTERLFRAADLINADGQPLVTVSRFKSSTPLPERVATTDLFEVVARKAVAADLSFYMFGADEAENAAAVAKVRSMFPDLRIVGRSHGYLKGDALRDKVDEINALAPFRQPGARAKMDAERRPRMGLANLAGAASAVLALSHHQSARTVSAVQQEPAFKHRSDATHLASPV